MLCGVVVGQEEFNRLVLDGSVLCDDDVLAAAKASAQDLSAREGDTHTTHYTIMPVIFSDRSHYSRMRNNLPPFSLLSSLFFYLRLSPLCCTYFDRSHAF